MSVNCSSGCPTKNHATFGECLRAMNLHIAYCNSAGPRGDFTEQKRWDKELDLYRSAKEQGINPAGTTTPKVREALDRSDASGAAFDAGVAP